MSIYDSFYERIAALTVQKIYDIYSGELGIDLLSQIISSDPNLMTAIEAKAIFRTYEDFLPYISPSLKPFAYKVIYNLTGKTQEMLENI